MKSLVGIGETWRFIFCAASVFVCFVIYGYMLETIFQIKGSAEIKWFVTVVYFANFSFLSFVQLMVNQESLDTDVSLPVYLFVSVATVGTMGLSNASMAYLNYPTHVIFKSCKLIPVMIGSVIILGKRYSVMQIVACILMILGLIWFSLVDSEVQVQFNFTGVALVSSALCCDAFLANTQEMILNKLKEPKARLVFYSHLIGLNLLSIALLVHGTFIHSLEFLFEYFWELMPAILALSLSGYCGMQAVLALISNYGALTAVTVTTARKAISILVSFFFFAKPFSIQYVYAGLLVVLGIYINVFSKHKGGTITNQLKGFGASVSNLISSILQ